MESKAWQLYNLLKTDPNKWWSCEEIHNEIPSFKLVDDERNPSPEITKTRLIINESDETDKIVVTKSHKFKIADRQEYAEERAKQISRLKGLVAQIEAKDRKYERDGQGKLFTNVLTELKPENEQYHETFIENEFVFVNLLDKKAYVVKNCAYEFVSEDVVKIITNKDIPRSITPIHEVITRDKLNMPFYENYGIIYLN